MNRLQYETSPYLLQHKNNPVDWYPWGEEAFKKSKEDDKPILLSIGYSACHWCHVMEKESFENESIAGIMNENFVNIKVDREEHPEVDNIYMNFVQLTTGSGGWPLTVVLTPDLIPIYGGTYFPPEDKYGRPGFLKILIAVKHAYKEKKDEILNHSSEVLKALSGLAQIPKGQTGFTETDFDMAFDAILKSHDKENGGFGKAPKFPQTTVLSFLLYYYVYKKNPAALEITESTLQKMSSGGIYDQIGGGFHRYSTDDEWLVPHFEKMLYDNALLSKIYLDTFRATKNDYYLGVAEDILEYILREMTDISGGFYSAQDADSEGEEGKFFVWSYAEFKEIVGNDDWEAVSMYYGVSEPGNFEGKNILTAGSISFLTKELKVKEKDLSNRISGIRKRLFFHREKRIKPGLDDKILTNWNALILSSFSLAYGITGKEKYLLAAIQNAEFIWLNYFKNGILYHSGKNGNVNVEGFLDDYSNLVNAFINLYEVTFNELWLQRADSLLKILIEKFYDKENSDFYFTPGNMSNLVIRTKDIYDNPTPSGNSVTSEVCLKMAVYMNNPEYYHIAHNYLTGIRDIVIQYPSNFAYALTSALFDLIRPKEIAIISKDDISLHHSIKEFFNVFPPFTILAGKVDGSKTSLEILKDKSNIFEKISFYICENFMCKYPVNSLEEVKNEILV